MLNDNLKYGSLNENISLTMKLTENFFGFGVKSSVVGI